MSNDEFAGSDNTDYGSSADQAADGNELDSVGSEANAPPMSARDFLSRRQEIKEKQASRSAKMTNSKSDSTVASEEGDASEEEKDDSQSSKADKNFDKRSKDVPSPKFQQRIDKLTARYHEAERKVAQKDVELEKFRKATEILQKELERVSKVAKLDPREERIRQLEYQREVEQFTNNLANKEEEIYNSSLSEYQVQARADEILDEVNELAEQYDLVSPEEILIAMRDKNLTATQAARQIHNARLEKAQKRVANKHPSTVSKSGAGSTAPVQERYQGAETIKKFFLQRMAERGGKAE